MKPKEFRTYLNRDQGCYHCGQTGDTLVPQHRAGRGMGGSKTRNRPANIIVLCSLANGLLESNANFANKGRLYGWKLHSWEDPTLTPVYEVATGKYWLLDDQGNRQESSHTL